MSCNPDTDAPPPTRSVLAFVGGTGREGRGLALRFAAAGHPVVIGSRDEVRAAAAAETIRERLARSGRVPSAPVRATTNDAAVEAADIVYLTMPFAGVDAFLAGGASRLAGKIVVDVINPLRLADGRFELIPIDEGCVSRRIARREPGARVVAAFKNAAAGHLLALDRPAEGDIPIAGDDADAKAIVADLVRQIPVLRPIDAGPLANAGFLESLTALELNLNKLHGATTSIRVLGL